MLSIRTSETPTVSLPLRIRLSFDFPLSRPELRVTLENRCPSSQTLEQVASLQQRRQRSPRPVLLAVNGGADEMRVDVHPATHEDKSRSLTQENTELRYDRDKFKLRFSFILRNKI